MPRKQKQLIVATIVVAVAAFLVTSGVTARTGRDQSGRAPAPPPSTAGPLLDRQAPSPRAAAGATDGDLRSYAISLRDLPGLPPDAPAGARMEIWVAWEPPLTRRATIQLLLRHVILERIVTGISPHTPPTALLLVKPSQVGDLLYADRWGRLSAVLLPGE
jgi:hypothetical protein